MLGHVLKQNKLTFSFILFKNCVFLLRDGFELTMIHLRTVPALYFITGELPRGEDTQGCLLSLLEVVKYLLSNSGDNSRTWVIHVRHLCHMYGITCGE